MDCRTVAACKRDGYAFFPVSLPSSARVLHQDLCSKEMEGEKGEKDRDNCKLQCGKW